MAADELYFGQPEDSDPQLKDSSVSWSVSTVFASRIGTSGVLPAPDRPVGRAAPTVVEPDRNNRGILDPVDIANCTSKDDNCNGIPDECENTCYPDCDQSTGVGVLDIFDFLAFQTQFVAGCP